MTNINQNQNTTDETIVNENVSVLLDQLLKAEDPATIGIRRIIKGKIDEANTFPVKRPEMESFDEAGNTIGHKAKNPLFNENERAVLELEKKVRELERTITQERVAAKKNEIKARDEGKMEGIKEGEEKGYDRAKKNFDTELAQLKAKTAKMFEGIEAAKKEAINGLDHILLKFCMELVKKITACELEINPNIVLASIKKSLALIADRDNILIRVAPKDLQTASDSGDFLGSVTERLENVRVEEDPRITKGGCIVESNSGLVDARLGVQLDEIEDLVNKAWEASEHGASGG